MVDLIGEAYNRCKVDESLEPGDDRYVPLSELGVRGTDKSCIEFLRAGIALSDGATHQLFSGFRGSGKTTELLWLKKHLTDDGFEVVYVDTEEFLNLRVPASITDLLITVAAGFDRHLGGDIGAGDKLPFRRFWDRLGAFFGTEITVENAKVKVPGVDLGVAFKKDLDFKSRLDEALRSQGRLPELARQCQDFVEECLALIKSRRPDSQGTVLILDSFEKLRGDLGNAEEVRRSVESIFVRDWDYLELPCHTVYTVPPWLAFMEAAVTAEHERAYILPMSKVHEPTDNGAAAEPSRPGIEAMMELLGKRMQLSELLADANVLEPLVMASGGYPRDLLRMVRELLLRIKMAGLELPVAKKPAQDLVKRVIEVHTELFEAPLNQDNLQLLVEVGHSHKISGHSREDLHRLAELFDHHFVLSYRNGQTWFDLHPLVRRTATVQAALAVTGKTDDENDR
jgi:hypothetical protein